MVCNFELDRSYIIGGYTCDSKTCYLSPCIIAILLNLHYVDLHTLQGEMQQLREKLAVAERTAKAEAQMKVRKINFFNNLLVVPCEPFTIFRGVC